MTAVTMVISTADTKVDEWVALKVLKKVEMKAARWDLQMVAGKVVMKAATRVEKKAVTWEDGMVVK